VLLRGINRRLLSADGPQGGGRPAQGAGRAPPGRRPGLHYWQQVQVKEARKGRQAGWGCLGGEQGILLCACHDWEVAMGAESMKCSCPCRCRSLQASRDADASRARKLSAT